MQRLMAIHSLNTLMFGFLLLSPRIFNIHVQRYILHRNRIGNLELRTVDFVWKKTLHVAPFLRYIYLKVWLLSIHTTGHSALTSTRTY